MLQNEPSSNVSETLVEESVVLLLSVGSPGLSQWVTQVLLCHPGVECRSHDNRLFVGGDWTLWCLPWSFLLADDLWPAPSGCWVVLSSWCFLCSLNYLHTFYLVFVYFNLKATWLKMFFGQTMNFKIKDLTSEDVISTVFWNVILLAISSPELLVVQ